MKLTEFEKSCIGEILREEDPDYLGHLTYLSVNSRDMTGVGFFTRLKYEENYLTIKLEDKTLGLSLYADMAELKHGAGFVLYIDEGRITCLEGFTHGNESWPEAPNQYSFRSETIE